MAGFATAVRTGLVLNVQQRMRVDFSLALGAVDQSVEIHAESPLLETVSDGGTVLTARLGPRTNARSGEPLRVSVDVERVRSWLEKRSPCSLS